MKGKELEQDALQDELPEQQFNTWIRPLRSQEGNGELRLLAPNRFVLDKHHSIEAGQVFPVCGNTWRMLQDTRFAQHFTFIGDFSQHFGLFEGCGLALPFDRTISVSEASPCC